MVEIGCTLRAMYKRELHRLAQINRRNGRYRPSPSEEFWTIFIILALFVVLGAFSLQSLNISALNFSDISLTTFLMPIVFYITLKVSLEIKWAI
jgi:hypothetical protein